MIKIIMKKIGTSKQLFAVLLCSKLLLQQISFYRRQLFNASQKISIAFVPLKLFEKMVKEDTFTKR